MNLQEQGQTFPTRFFWSVANRDCPNEPRQHRGGTTTSLPRAAGGDLAATNHGGPVNLEQLSRDIKREADSEQGFLERICPPHLCSDYGKTFKTPLQRNCWNGLTKSKRTTAWTSSGSKQCPTTRTTRKSTPAREAVPATATPPTPPNSAAAAATGTREITDEDEDSAIIEGSGTPPPVPANHRHGHPHRPRDRPPSPPPPAHHRGAKLHVISTPAPDFEFDSTTISTPRPNLRACLPSASRHPFPSPRQQQLKRFLCFRRNRPSVRPRVFCASSQRDLLDDTFCHACLDREMMKVVSLFWKDQDAWRVVPLCCQKI
ncbi:hypothetical protein BV898_16418 [Hypsibius exemplaris]|uniref:Uncharacterized protein n=1 Tax=Hypsibius exemplaris TaxID=2072580 RepID=A0A9X6NER8_HYPEX|nr:hypothetical protein BV898_16418 [Hypsibius exemplaris]